MKVEKTDARFKYLSETASTTLKIPLEEAEKRVELLFESGILEGFNPDDVECQRMVDNFLSQDSETLAGVGAYKIAFETALGNEDLIKAYDKLRPKAHMAYTLKQIETGKMNVKEEREAKKQFDMFEKFFLNTIWSRLEPTEN